MAEKSRNKGMKIKKGDTVRVIAGADKGAEGRVIAVQPERDRVIAEVGLAFRYNTELFNDLAAVKAAAA